MPERKCSHGIKEGATQGGMATPAFRIRVVDESGRSVEFEPDGVEPLSADDILKSGVAGSNAFDLKFQATGATVDGAPRPGRATFRGTVTFNQPLSIYALTNGGWLPPPLVLPPMFLVDRNVVATLRRLRQGTRRQDSVELAWWLDLLRGGNTWFNPLPCAMEGGTRSIPTLAEFMDGFNESAKEIATSFPEAQIPRFELEHFEAAYELISDLGKRSAIEAAFLIRAIPLVTVPVATEKLDGVKSTILELARDHRIQPGALVLVAALSCLYGDEEYAIGRGILKPERGYGEDNAYNALSDLKQIELLIASMGLPQFGPFSLCTCDRALALFWCALSPRFRGWAKPTGATFGLTLDARLFPRLGSTRLEELKSALLGTRSEG